MTAENPTTLGEFLRHERERRGITIEQLASATKIGVRTLHALEADRYVDLPAKPFVRGFVTSYCRFVGIDSQEVLSRFERFLDDRAQERPARDSGHSGYAFEKREGEQSRTVLWFVMGAFIVIGGVALFFLKPTLRHRKASHLERLSAAHVSPSPQVSQSPETRAVVASADPAPSSTSVLTPAPILSPTPVSTPTLSPTPALNGIQVAAPTPTPTVTPPAPEVVPAPEKPDPLNSGAGLLPSEVKQKILVKALDDVWVRFRSDERPTMKFILRKDRILVVRARSIIRFQVSNLGGVALIHNGRKLTHEGGGDDAGRRVRYTWVFPQEMAEKVKDPFPGEKPLPATTPPSPRGASPSPTPRQ